ncbi:MAG: TIM barrel protein [Oscillospiraceae bacterium]|nr:TIM barrel protein [Oscillospiraceae bacterium]
MLKFSPCIEMMFTKEYPDFYDRFKAAKDSGADAVDFWGWSGKDMNRIGDLINKYGLTISSVCVDTTDSETAKIFAEKRLLTRDKDAFGAFYKSCQESIKMAQTLKIPSLIVTTGNERPNNITRYEQHANIVLMLKHAAPLFEDSGVTLIVEPLNILCDHVGYFLSSSYEAFEICNEVGSKNIKVLYDIYHQQITEGNLIPTIRKYFDLIGHFHVADVPGRNEPGTGEINYRNVFKAIEDLGYDKYVGLEYRPVADSAKTIEAVFELCK